MLAFKVLHPQMNGRSDEHHERFMLAGKRFKLTTPTLAIDVLNGKRVGVTVPAGTILKVVSGPSDGDRMVNVRWEGRTLVMFAIDLSQRGTEV